MNSKNHYPKTYRLSNIWQWTIIFPSLLLALMVLMPFVLPMSEDNSLGDWICYFSMFLGFPCIGILYSFSCRLTTSPSGLGNLFFYPFKQIILWENVERIELSMFGIVHLVYRSDGTNKLLDKLSGQKIQISFFVNNWKENELIQDIRKFAPQATIPPEIYNRTEVKIMFRPIVLLLYYLLCMVALLLPMLAIPDSYFQSFKYAWDLSGFGLMGGIFGGMLTLLEYGAWLDTKPTDKEVRIIAMILYFLPFSGWVIVFITGIFLQQVIASEEGGRYLGIANLLALLIGALQFKIISKVVKRFVWI